jgi:hypothetical protein
MNKAIWLAAMLGCAALAQTASAQTATTPTRDGVYRGTLVCGGMLTMRSRPRSAVELTISGRDVKFSRPVVEKDATIGTETGAGTLDGDKVALTGAWKSDKAGFESSYTGTFVRRASLKLTGTQTWTQDGKTTRRNCSGSAKRSIGFFRRKAG